MRNHDFERDFLEHAGRRSRCYSRPYIETVMQRLRVGGERYGDAAFLDRDNYPPLLEETPDLAGWAVLEAQRLLHLVQIGRLDADAWQVAHDHLVQIAVEGFVADYHARRAQEIVAGALRED